MGLFYFIFFEFVLQFILINYFLIMAMENLDSNLINEEPLEEKYLKLKERLEKDDLDLQKLREIVKNISSQQVIENPNLPLEVV